MKITPYYNLSWRLGWVIILSTCSAFLWRGYTQQTKDIEGEKVKQYIWPLLQDPHFINLDWSQPFFWNTVNGYVHLPDEKPEHPEGVFRVSDPMATVYNVAPLRAGCYATQVENRVLTEDQKYPDEEECKQVALQFMKNHFSWFFAIMSPPSLIVMAPHREGIWFFRWQHLDKDGFFLDNVDAQVRAIDGKLIGFGASKRIAPWPAHRLTPLQVKGIARGIAIKNINTGGLFKDVKVVSATLEDESSPPRYQVIMEAQRRDNGLLFRAALYVDANTGKISYHGDSKKLEWVSIDAKATSDDISEYRDSHILVEDSQPAWTQQGLIFVSNRTSASVPAWAVFPSQLMLLNQSMAVTRLTSDMTYTPGAISGSSHSSWITLVRSQWSYAFNLSSGTYKVIASPDRGGLFPALDADGRWAVACGNGKEPKSTIDLFADDLSRASVMPNHRARLVAIGDQNHPIFSPNGHWLYFITTTVEPVGKGTLKPPLVTYSLQRVAAEQVEVRQLTQLDTQQVATIINALPYAVDRLSIFPDGNHLLAQTQKGMYVLSVADKQITSLNLKNLVDDELDGMILQESKDGWAGPTDDEVTFSGKTVDKAGKIRWRIYSCHLDGSGLKAWTPKDNLAVAAYKFPEGGKTSIDLAKAWALSEIQLKDEQKRRSR